MVAKKSKDGMSGDVVNVRRLPSGGAKLTLRKRGVEVWASPEQVTGLIDEIDSLANLINRPIWYTVDQKDSKRPNKLVTVEGLKRSRRAGQ